VLSSTITAKGQTTIPAEIRKKLNLKPGDRLLYIEEDGKVRDLKGLLPKPDQPVSLEDMDAAIATGRTR